MLNLIMRISLYLQQFGNFHNFWMKNLLMNFLLNNYFNICIYIIFLFSANYNDLSSLLMYSKSIWILFNRAKNSREIFLANISRKVLRKNSLFCCYEKNYEKHWEDVKFRKYFYCLKKGSQFPENHHFLLETFLCGKIFYFS